MAYMMGIDVGTTGTRAVIVRPDGHVVGAATGDHQPMRMAKPGWAEQDPEDWWQATLVAIRAALAQSGVKGSDIAAVGFSGQMHGVVLLDKALAVIRPSLIWCDQRSQAQCDWITQKVGAEQLIQYVSNPALTGFSAPKILWVRDNEPQFYERAAHFLLPKDFVRFRLTGEFATDVSDASGTLLFDVTHRRWSREMLSALEIDPRILPKAFESPEITGKITREVAVLTGLSAGTPVVAGGGDQAASAVGNGIVLPGLTSATLGTSGVIFTYTDAPKLDPRGRIHTFCHAVPGKWHVMGVTQGAGLSLRWFRDNFGYTESWYARQADVDPYELIIREAEKVRPGSDGLLWLPYLMGERTPHLDSQARGMWFGIDGVAHASSLWSAPSWRAWRSACAILWRSSRSWVSPSSRSAPRAAARAVSLWRQIQADIYGKELVTPAHLGGVSPWRRFAGGRGRKDLCLGGRVRAGSHPGERVHGAETGKRCGLRPVLSGLSWPLSGGAGILAHPGEVRWRRGLTRGGENSAQGKFG